MFLPHAIDMLNRRNFRAIQQLEAATTHIKNLEALCEQLGADLRDVKQLGNDKFAFEIAAPAYWAEHRKELELLLVDYRYGKPIAENATGKLISAHLHHHLLVITPISHFARAAA